MKKVLFFVGLFIISGNIVLAQSNNLRKAKSNYARYEELGGMEAGELAIKFLQDAISPIESATEHDRTKDNPETWAVYSLIYSNLALAEKNEEYAQKTIQGLEKAKALDEEDKNETNIEASTINIRNYYQVIGYDSWQENDFTAAHNSFEKGLEIVPGDTTLLFYSGYAAIQSQDWKKAIERHEALVPVTDYSDHKFVVSNLPRLYLELQDTTKAIELAAKAVELYPDDNDVAFQNIELNLVLRNEDKIIKDIEDQVSRDPENAILYYYLGIAYSAIDDEEKALEAYKNSLAIDPDYVDANLNTAATIMNITNKSVVELSGNRELSNDDYTKQLEELKGEMGAAIPYLEKVLELEPDNGNALRNLKSYYDFVQDEEKSAEIQAKIDALYN